MDASDDIRSYLQDLIMQRTPAPKEPGFWERLARTPNIVTPNAGRSHLGTEYILGQIGRAAQNVPTGKPAGAVDPVQNALSKFGGGQEIYNSAIAKWLKESR